MDGRSAEYHARQLHAGGLGFGNRQVLVAESGHQRGKNLLDAEAAAEFLVVHVLAHDRLEIDEIVGDALEPVPALGLGSYLNTADGVLAQLARARSLNPVGVALYSYAVPTADLEGASLEDRLAFAERMRELIPAGRRVRRRFRTVAYWTRLA